ncbi:hypothetical protein HAX54_018845 [Datura stramonium]|uniref:Uncharacterized protein n=1 Tax=Datura stramonium TaxID=4076 RepID=A0ABS8RJ92_DATST|nr:hypothetical protein [Datura stramonium]
MASLNPNPLLALSLFIDHALPSSHIRLHPCHQATSSLSPSRLESLIWLDPGHNLDSGSGLDSEPRATDLWPKRFLPPPVKVLEPSDLENRSVPEAKPAQALF